MKCNEAKKKAHKVWYKFGKTAMKTHGIRVLDRTVESSSRQRPNQTANCELNLLAKRPVTVFGHPEKFPGSHAPNPPDFFIPSLSLL